MTTNYPKTLDALKATPGTWLVTGAAGFIGSILLETLLLHDQRVVGLDNFSTGHRRNLEEVRSLATPAQWSRFEFIEGDIRHQETCRKDCEGIGCVLLSHHCISAR